MTKAAGLYGGSLYDLAAEEGLTGTMLEEMQEIRKLFRENPEYVSLLAQPAVPREERLDLIEKAFGSQAERYLVNFIKLLCERNLLSEYAGCCEEFKRRYYADHGIAEASVTSAVPLNESQAEALKSRLEKNSGKKIVLIQKTDPSVLAGLRVELEGKQLDGTVQSRLEGISRKLEETLV